MGMICPECGKRSAVKSVITADGQGARKAEDVIAYRLECGHTVGGEDYTNFVKQCHLIDADTQAEIRAYQESARAHKAALWKTISDDSEESEEHAE